jgi:GNAT superfamily N-acetyltransferase
MTNVTIRRATNADISQVANLFDAYRVFYGKTSDVRSAHAFISERMHSTESVIFVADDHGTLAGFTQLYPLFSSVRMKKLWLLNDLFVDPKFRGKGLSIQLLDAAKQLCRDSGACGMYLETAKSNDIGNTLYPRAGFKLNDEHNFYDWDCEVK